MPIPEGVRLIFPLAKLVDIVVLENVKFPRFALPVTNNVGVVIMLPTMVLPLSWPKLALIFPAVEIKSPVRLIVLPVIPLMVMLPTVKLPDIVRLPSVPKLVING